MTQPTFSLSLSKYSAKKCPICGSTMKVVYLSPSFHDKKPVYYCTKCRVVEPINKDI